MTRRSSIIETGVKRPWLVALNRVHPGKSVAPKPRQAGHNPTDIFQGVLVADASNFSKLVPGFEFLQGMVKGAGAAIPSMGQWVAPTLNPEELSKRIDELRTVQFWLEQNARMLEATIQALEVQRMTLTTLKTMNVQMEDLRESLKVKTPEPTSAPAQPAAAASASPQGDGSTSQAAPVDPMQWWGALTKQFTELAAAAVKDSMPANAPRTAPSAKATGKHASSPVADTASPAPTQTSRTKGSVITKTAAAKTRGARSGYKR